MKCGKFWLLRPRKGNNDNYQEVFICAFVRLYLNTLEYSYFVLLNLKTSVIRQKGEVTGKQSAPNFPRNKHFLPPDTQTYVCLSVGKICLFFGKFGALCFLVTCILRFTLLPYYRRKWVHDLPRKAEKIWLAWKLHKSSPCFWRIPYTNCLKAYTVTYYVLIAGWFVVKFKQSNH